jgi:hypothetical protein
VLEPGLDLDRLIDDTGHPLDEHSSAPALRAGVGVLCDQLRPSLERDPAGEIEPFLAQHTAGDEEQVGSPERKTRAASAALAETSDSVAMATKYRAIATLSGASTAEIWGPRPATVHSSHRP